MPFIATADWPCPNPVTPGSDYEFCWVMTQDPVTGADWWTVPCVRTASNNSPFDLHHITGSGTKYRWREVALVTKPGNVISTTDWPSPVPQVVGVDYEFSWVIAVSPGGEDVWRAPIVGPVYYADSLTTHVMVASGGKCRWREKSTVRLPHPDLAAWTENVPPTTRTAYTPPVMCQGKNCPEPHQPYAEHPKDGSPFICYSCRTTWRAK